MRVFDCNCNGKELVIGATVRRKGRATVGEIRGIHQDTAVVRVYWPTGDYFTSHRSLRRFTSDPSYRSPDLELIDREETTNG